MHFKWSSKHFSSFKFTCLTWNHLICTIPDSQLCWLHMLVIPLNSNIQNAFFSHRFRPQEEESLGNCECGWWNYSGDLAYHRGCDFHFFDWSVSGRFDRLLATWKSMFRCRRLLNGCSCRLISRLKHGESTPYSDRTRIWLDALQFIRFSGTLLTSRIRSEFAFSAVWMFTVPGARSELAKSSRTYCSWGGLISSCETFGGGSVYWASGACRRRLTILSSSVARPVQPVIKSWTLAEQQVEAMAKRLSLTGFWNTKPDVKKCDWSGPTGSPSKLSIVLLSTLPAVPCQRSVPCQDCCSNYQLLKSSVRYSSWNVVNSKVKLSYRNKCSTLIAPSNNYWNA